MSNIENKVTDYSLFMKITAKISVVFLSVFTR